GDLCHGPAYFHPRKFSIHLSTSSSPCLIYDAEYKWLVARATTHLSNGIVPAKWPFECSTPRRGVTQRHPFPTLIAPV
ncbi:MAG TPA: hypothetical protein VNT99_04585, partial [Methylomirabilota bacterium]|nr:hypothetical protein [Methylomirabilota bacterium]